MFRMHATLTGFGGAPGFSTFYFFGTEQSDADAANAALLEFWNDLASLVNNDLEIAGGQEAEFVDEATGQITGIAAVNGYTAKPGIAAERCADTTQGLLRWRTNVFVNGRELRGRLFIPCPLEQVNTGGAPSTTAVTAMSDAGTTLVNALAVGNELVVYSRTHFQAAPVTLAQPWNKWAVLRSRRD